MKIQQTVMGVFVILALTGCASRADSAPAPVPGDAYGEGTELALPGKEQITLKSTVANIEPYEIGVISLYTSNLLGIGSNATSMSVFFAPRENEVRVDFLHAGGKYSLFFDAKDRVLLIGSIKTYLEDFAQRRLDRDKDMDAAYGNVLPRMEWGMLTRNAIAEPRVRIGYVFEKNAPYYSLTYPETKNLIYQKDLGSRVKNSGYMRWYMTRSQAEAFGNMLDQAFLESTLSTQTLPGGSAEPDAY